METKTIKVFNRKKDNDDESSILCYVDADLLVHVTGYVFFDVEID